MIFKDEWKLAFSYGSQVYGTNNENSDEDYLIVGGYTAREYKEDNKNIRIFPLQDFIVFLEMHEPIALECISMLKLNDKKHVKVLDTKFSVIINHYYNNTFNLTKLRKAFSQKASNSLVKAKKKVLYENEDYYIGMKSLYHSIRLFYFGIQIAKTNYIYNFSESNYIWYDILNYEYDFKIVDNENDYKALTEKWKKLYNEKHSEFKECTSK